MTDSSARVLDARLLLSIIAAGIMSFSGVVVETAMNVTFPTLMHEFNIGTSLVQWVTTGYLLVLALIIPTSAYLKRRLQRAACLPPQSAAFLRAHCSPPGRLISMFCLSADCCRVSVQALPCR